MRAKDVVVDDGPFRGDGDRRAALDHEDGRLRRHQRDLTSPVSFDRGRTDHEVRPCRREMPQRHDRLSRLAEAHVVREDRAAPPSRNAPPDWCETDHRQAQELSERGVRVVAGHPKQVCERRSLRVERIAGMLKDIVRLAHKGKPPESRTRGIVDLSRLSLARITDTLEELHKMGGNTAPSSDDNVPSSRYFLSNNARRP